MKRLLIILLLLIAAPSLAMEPIDFSKPLARMGVTTMGAGVAAAASTFCTDATHTTQNPSTAVRLCEDLESTTSCFTGGNNYCRVTWTILTNDVDDTVAAIEGTHSFGLDGSAAATEGVRYDTGAASATLGAFAYIKVNALPATAGHIKQFMAVGTTTAQAFCELKQDGTLSAYATARATGTAQKVSAGSSYYFWIWYDDSSGASDGVIYCCFSTTTTRPTTPATDTDYCSYKADHTVTTDVDNIHLTNGYSTTFNAITVDKVVVSTSEIGNNP